MTYEEYYRAVKNVLRFHLQAFELSDDELEQYMQREIATIEQEYRLDKQRFDKGEITLNVFSNGCVNSTAWCLKLMYV